MPPPSPPSYAELYCRSNFSFLRGASHPEELVQRAWALGYTALALTDEASLGGVVRAHLAAKDRGLALLIGSEIGLDEGPTLVLLAPDRDGYGNLCQLISLGRRRAPKGHNRLSRADLEGGLPGCLALWLPGDDPADADGAWLAERFAGEAWIGVALHRSGGDRLRLERLRALGRRWGLPLVAVGGVRMHIPERGPLLDTLEAIRRGVPVAQLGETLAENREHHLRPREELARFYPADQTRREAPAPVP